MCERTDSYAGVLFDDVVVKPRILALTFFVAYSASIEPMPFWST